MSAVSDAFTFWNEFEALKIRLHELDPVVDRLILVEATWTHSGQRKEALYRKHSREFDWIKPYLPKIVNVVLEDMPDGEDPWVRENYQRNAIGDCLGFLERSEWALISDVDEIPRAEAVRQAIASEGQAVFEQRLYYYHLNRRCVEEPWWYGTRLSRIVDIDSPQSLRNKSKEEFPRVIRDAGWHFSYLGGVSAIQSKLKAYAHHREFDKDQFTDREHISACIRNGTDLFGRNYTWLPEPIDESFPKWVQENRSEIAWMIQ